MPLLFHLCHKIKKFQMDGQTWANLNAPPLKVGAQKLKS